MQATIYKTAEGIYLYDESEKTKLKNAGVKLTHEPLHNMGLYNHLILSEIDTLRWDDYVSQAQMKNRICDNMLTSIRTLKDREQHFESIIDPVLNKTTIIYADKGIIWIPKCFKLEKFELDANRDTQCYKDIKVRVTIVNSNKSNAIPGYLNKENIITMKSMQRNCNESIARLIEENGNYSALMDINNNIYKKAISHTVRLYPIENEILKYNFPHYKELLNEIDLTEIIIRNSEYSDIYSKMKLKMVHNGDSSNTLLLIINNMKEGGEQIIKFFSNTYTYVKLIMYGITVTVIVLLIVLVIIILIKIINYKQINDYKLRYKKFKLVKDVPQITIR